MCHVLFQVLNSDTNEWETFNPVYQIFVTDTNLPVLKKKKTIDELTSYTNEVASYWTKLNKLDLADHVSPPLGRNFPTNLQKMIDRDLYDHHVVLTAEEILNLAQQGKEGFGELARSTEFISGTCQRFGESSAIRAIICYDTNYQERFQLNPGFTKEVSGGHY